MTLPQKKYAILSSLIVMLAAPNVAWAQSSASLSGLYACEALTDKDAQLSCFLTETARLRAAETSGSSVAVPVEPVAVETLSAPAPAAPEFAPLPEKKAKAPRSRTLGIRHATTMTNGNVRFTLENGEVWLQIEKARVRLGKGSPDSLTIKRKSFGSFIGTVNGKRPSFRLRRVE
ncbi:MAG: hypothetical protein ABJN22_11560 [Litorimonas sp.]